MRIFTVFRGIKYRGRTSLNNLQVNCIYRKIFLIVRDLVKLQNLILTALMTMDFDIQKKFVQNPGIILLRNSGMLYIFLRSFERYTAV